MTNKRAAQVVQAVKFLLDDGQYTEEVEEALNLAIKALEDRPQGKWEILEDADGKYGVCSICDQDTDFSHYGEAYDYCPNCGAKMEDDNNG